MNLHPDILAQAALLPRPNSFQELRNTVGLIKERLAVLTDRQRPEVRATGAQGFDRFSRVSDRQRGSAVSNQQANRGGLTVGNSTDGDIFKKTVGKEILLGL